MAVHLIDKTAFCQLADQAIEMSPAEHTMVSLSDFEQNTTRFANNQIVQNVNSRRQTLLISVAIGQQHGTASTTDLSEPMIRETVQRAVALAQHAPSDPEYLPPLPPQRYMGLTTVCSETAEAGPSRRVEEARKAIDLCQKAELNAAGIVRTSLGVVGFAATSGLFAYEQQSQARFSLTAIGPTSTGWVDHAHRSIDQLGVAERTEVAIRKAKQSASPKEIPAGRYTVILEPAAVAGLVAPILWMTGAKAYHKGTSPLLGKLGKQIVDQRLTLQNRPDHPALLGAGFNQEGLPTDQKTWIQDGVLTQLMYDRFTANEHGVPPTYWPDAPHLSGQGPTGVSVDKLIRSTKRGILVTNFWYIRFANVTDLTLTGMTRDGTFLVEDGQITSRLVNFRFHDSPLRAFNAIDAFTTPTDAINAEQHKMLLPAMIIRDFNFSSVTRF